MIGSPCISTQLSRELESLLDRAVKEFNHARYPQAIELLASIEARVLQTPHGFSGCTVNTAGEIRARVRSASFLLSKLQ